MKAERDVYNYLDDFCYFAKYIIRDENGKKPKKLKKHLKVLRKALKDMEKENYEEVFTEDQDPEELFII